MLSQQGLAMDWTNVSHYSKEDKSFFNPEPYKTKIEKMGFVDTLKVLKKVFFDKSTRAPLNKLPYIKPEMKDFITSSSHTKFIWFGHSTLLLNIDSKIILVDPVFSDYAFALDMFVKRFQEPVMNLKELPKIDLILISHNHYDHLDKKSIEFFKSSETPIYAPLGLTKILTEWGINEKRISEFDWGDEKEFEGIKLISTPARHFSGRTPFDRNETLWQSWVIKGKTETTYFSGDSGYGSHFKMIGEKYGPIDLAFMENGQYNEQWADIHMMPEETVQAFIDLKAKYFVPIHWGMFDLSIHNWDEPVVRTYALAMDKGLNYLSPHIGETVELESLQSFSPWWQEVHSVKE